MRNLLLMLENLPDFQGKKINVRKRPLLFAELLINTALASIMSSGIPELLQRYKKVKYFANVLTK